MSRLARHAEVLKLARVLRVPAEQLKHLQSLDAASLRRFREQASAVLFDADAARLKRVALASKLLPVPLIALIAEHVFGALLCARVSGLMAPDRAADVAQRLRTGFLADVTLEIDPRQVREVIARVPVQTIVAVALELARRGEYVTLARFVDFVSNAAIRAVMDQLTDNRALLQIAFFVEDAARLDDLIGLLPEPRLDQVIRLVADDAAGLFAEGLSLMSQVGVRWRRQLAERAATLDESILQAMARAAQDQGLWSALLPVIAVMSTPHQRRLANLPILREAPVLEAILDAVDADDLWQALMPLVPLMSEAGQDQLARSAEKLPDAAFARVFQCAREAGAWSTVIILLLRMGAATRERIRPLVSQLSADSARQILQQADQLGLLEGVSRLWESLARRA